MKQLLVTGLVCMLCFLFFTGCAQGTGQQASSVPTNPVEAWKSDRGKQELACEIAKTLTSEEKIGQLLILGIAAPALTENDRDVLESCRAGGVILFDRNMESKEQVAALIQDLQKLHINSRQLPLFVAIDQEGGLVTRMRHALLTPPPASVIAAGKDTKIAYDYAYQTGRELKALGFNVNFAPVLDISDNMDGRTYGSTPEQVALFGREAARGLEDSGLLFTVKHFPGMGRSVTDPHHNTSSVKISKEDLLQKELLPFRSVITQTRPDKMLVMVGHVRYPDVDSEPASLSSVIITSILKKELGYEGLICTDDLDMGAISKNYVPETAGIKALQAGADLLLSCHTPAVQRRIYHGIVEALKNGSLSPTVIDKAAERVIYVKLKQLMTEEEVKAAYLRLHPANIKP